MNLPDDPTLHWLLRTSLEGALLIGLVLALRWALAPRLSAAWRVALWAMVGVKLLLPASLPIGLGFGALLPAEEAAVVEPVAAAIKEEGRPRPVSETWGEGAPTPWDAPAPFPIAALLAGVWAAGAALVLAVLLVREARFRRALAARPECDDREVLGLVRECAAVCDLARPPRVKLMPAGCGPAIAGVFAPVLLLPADWRERCDRAALRHVIFHELEHLRAGDLVWNWCAALLTAVHWFNPLVWLAAARFQADRELRCDARALARMAPAERIAYGRTLLRISETFLAPPAIAGLAPCVRNHPSLRHRILMITRPPASTPALQAVFAVALGTLICLSFGSARAQEEPAKDRSREGERSPEVGEPKRPAREGERAKEGEKMREGERGRDGEKAREGERPRDGERPRSGERDGDRPKGGERDGDRPKSGERDGDRPRSGERDGERPKGGERDGDRPRSGERDGDRPRTGARDGERPRDGERMRDGERGREGERARSREGEGDGRPPIAIRVLGAGDEVTIGDRTMPANQLRGFLKDYLAEHGGRPVVIDAEATTPFAAVAKVLDAARDSGAKNAQIRPAAGR